MAVTWKKLAYSDHIHTSGAVSFTPYGLLTSTNVQAALEQLLALVAASGGSSELQLSYSANLTIDFTTYDTQSIILTGNISFTLTNLTNGKPYRLIVEQDAAGSRTATFTTLVKWPSAVTPVLTLAGSKVDIFTFIKSRDIIYGDCTKTFY